MKPTAIKITYWVTTGIFSFMMAYSAYGYLTNPMFDQAFTHLGFPAYFRIELAILKIVGALVLILPVASRLKDLAYGGFALTLVSAVIAHLNLGDAPNHTYMPIPFLVILVVSYLTYRKKIG